MNKKNALQTMDSCRAFFHSFLIYRAKCFIELREGR